MTPAGLIAFPITPASADGRVDERAFRRLLQRLVQAKVQAVCVLGSTGSYPYLTRDERRRALEIAAPELEGRAQLLAGVGALRTDEAVQHARDTRAAGASVGLLAPMSYTPLIDDEVFAHFAAVGGESELPLCIYDNPASTHFTVSDTLVERLATLPGVIALKSPAPAPADVNVRIATLRERTPPDFSVGFSVDWNAAEAMLAGGDAWYSVLAGLFPSPAMAISQAAKRGDAATVRRLDGVLAPLWRLFRTYGGLRVVYAAAKTLGLCEHAPPRPILPLPLPIQDEVAAAIRGLQATLEG